VTFTTRPTLRGTFGMVSSTHWLASQSAMRMLELGGNAFDAAVSAAFVLHVVEPHLNGPGGEVPAIVATADDPRPRVLCGQGPAPAAATIEHFGSLGLDLIPGAGPLAAAVPGAVDAWLLMLRDHGTRTLREVLEPAIGYAQDGHPLAGGAVGTLRRVHDLFTEHWPTSAALWLADGLPAPNTLFRNRVYAATLELLVTSGETAGTDRTEQIERARKEWREGFVAEAIDRFARRPFRDSSGAEHAGLVTGADLAAYSANWEHPVTLDWQGYTIAKTGPWGQGPALLQALAILAANGDPADLDLTSADGVHTVVETVKLAYADREAWYGDGSGVPLDALLSSGYAAQRASLLEATASLVLRPGSPNGSNPVLPSVAAGNVEQDASTREPTLPAEGDTCHIDVVDRWGNFVSATPSGGWLQSSPAIPELGFCLGSRLQMFWLEEGLPASLAPGKRPRTTLTPTLVLRDGVPLIACGSPGGDNQDQWQLLFLLRHLAQEQDLQEAIDAPAWHTTGFPSSFWPRGTEPGGLVAEDRLRPAVLDDLARRGHRVTVTGPWSLGRLCAVRRDADGVVSAAANPRGMQGYASGR
jgi:gamma-glutamyltranspeptidase / glutathione hydrolase